jgi:hypothetical protein
MVAESARWRSSTVSTLGSVPFGRYPFGVDFYAEKIFAGVTIGSQLRAGWWWGSERQAEGEFFRATITNARYGWSR